MATDATDMLDDQEVHRIIFVVKDSGCLNLTKTDFEIHFPVLVRQESKLPRRYDSSCR